MLSLFMFLLQHAANVFLRVKIIIRLQIKNISIEKYFCALGQRPHEWRRYRLYSGCPAAGWQTSRLPDGLCGQGKRKNVYHIR